MFSLGEVQQDKQSYSGRNIAESTLFTCPRCVKTSIFLLSVLSCYIVHVKLSSES